MVHLVSVGAEAIELAFLHMLVFRILDTVFISLITFIKNSEIFLILRLR